MRIAKIREVCELMHVSMMGNKIQMLQRLSVAILNPKEDLYTNVIEDLVKEHQDNEQNDD